MIKKLTKPLPAQFITVETPRRFQLSGLWLGAARPRRVFIFVHGLSGNLFSRHEIAAQLVDGRTAALVFNNRGSGQVNGLRRRKGCETAYSALGGSAHEVFTDCVDDLDGAVKFARQQGVKEIYLVGHSTGCQKSVYYLARQPRSVVRGAVLLAPVSDYAAINQEASPAEYRRALAAAKRFARSKHPHALLPSGLWTSPIDAQRFLSLYTPESTEEIFGYATGRQPSILRKVRKPLLAVLAEQDQFHDRPTEEIAAWFSRTLADRPAQVVIISGVGHNFSPAGPEVARLIANWAAKIKK